MRDRDPWTIRPLVTLGLGLCAALAIQQLLERTGMDGSWSDPGPTRIALATTVGVAAVLAVFTLERLRWAWSAVFALIWGCTAGLVTFWSGPNGNTYDLLDWRIASLFLSIAIAAPLFQSARDARGRRIDYPEVHGHVWTNIVLLGAACAFTGISFALVYLLSELFSLIGIHLLRDLLDHDWANAALGGAAFGGAVGLFRERDAIVRALQRVITAVLAVLAPVLGAGLVLFLVALPFTGLAALWEATESTTPILLSCVIGAFVLANAVIGDAEEVDRGRVLRWGAMALGVAMLPLAAIAAVATGLRIDQYGFTPDRLWALTFIIVACAYGLAYLVALLRHRADWGRTVRSSNLRLAFGLAAAALLLSTPLVSFNAISARDQVARLESGRIAPEKFDWAALGFDFGAPGRAALRHLSGSSDALIAKLARETASEKTRYFVQTAAERERRRALIRGVRVIPAGEALPAGIATLLPEWNVCGDSGDGACVILYRAGDVEAVAVTGGCVAPVAADRKVTVCQTRRLALAGGAWRVDPETALSLDESTTAQLRGPAAIGAIEVRAVARRQVFIGGQPVGEVFE